MPAGGAIPVEMAALAEDHSHPGGNLLRHRSKDPNGLLKHLPSLNLSLANAERILRPRGKEDADGIPGRITTLEFDMELALEISCDVVVELLVKGIAAGNSPNIILGRIVCTALEDELSEIGEFPLSLLAGCKAEGTTLTSTCPNLLVVVEGIDSRVDAEASKKKDKEPKAEMASKSKDQDEEVPMIMNWKNSLEVLIATWPEVRAEEASSGIYEPIYPANMSDAAQHGDGGARVPVRRNLQQEADDTGTPPLTFRGTIRLEALLSEDEEGRLIDREEGMVGGRRKSRRRRS